MANNKNGDNKKMTVEEAGRKGGEATAENHDKEFYKEVGETRAGQSSDD